MIPKNLKNVLILTLALIFAHGVEEVVSGFYAQDSWMIFFGNLFNTKAEVFYWSFHIMWWILVPVGVILLIGSKRLVYLLLTLFGLLYITELHHVIKGVFAWHYYPGMITGIIYPFLGVFYWKELLISWRKYGRS